MCGHGGRLKREVVVAAATAELRLESLVGDLGPVGGRCQVVTRAGSEWPAGDEGGTSSRVPLQALLKQETAATLRRRLFMGCTS